MPSANGKTWNLFYPRHDKMLFWAGAGAGLLSILLTYVNRGIPLHWRGSLWGSSLNILAGTVHFVLVITFVITFFMFTAAIVRLAGRREKTEKLALWPALAAQILAVAALFLIPSQQGFAPNRPDYHRAVVLLDKETLPPKGMEVPLPDRLKKLSLTGKVVASRKDGTLIAYFLLDEAAGEYLRWLVFYSGARDPRPEDLLNNTSQVGVGVEKLEKHWFNVVIYKKAGKTD